MAVELMIKTSSSEWCGTRLYVALIYKLC